MKQTNRANRRKRRFAFNVDGVMCLVAALVLTGLGVAENLDTYWLDQRGEVVTATVLDEHGGKTTRIDVRYVTKAGQTIENDTVNYLDAEVGKEIQVVYDPENPYRMQAADWGLDYWLGGLWFVGAVFFVYFGVVQLWPRT
ncbi:uncharacterized protein DUF3592 [Kribbella orskensis]|uniref:Uncharacterized protein DUF3592 n=1 Tax=Kribbella orskensis TaxID=2512216 RepID=A0ABY2BVT0_9ACTN|nr:MULTISPECIES: DUF3592 domain-containing protein [Kribbella]TCN44072.1 uncharacterized protein DUF3592 [Kribbella sp. VKM Ac-2500]TCO32150.1 uncharacterized protein DUF3592 [Kribbella orskensis]